nr:ribosomal protein s kinase alpha [Hymenolepis microstoma]
MVAKPFKAEKFLGYGCFGVVYSVSSQQKHDWNKIYALKRFSMERPEALIFAMKEYNALKKVSLDDEPSPFIPKLFYAFTIYVSPVLVLNQASGITLFNIIEINGPLNIYNARFYITEIMCGLKFLHDRNIVHMECKPDNILISHLGHVILSDFDRSYDLTRSFPNNYDFLVAQYYAAPEVVCKAMITPQADVWTLGVLMTDLLGKRIRIGGARSRSMLHRAIGGIWTIDRFSRLRADLREFFNKTFTYCYVLRPNIPELQRLTFFKYINWEEVESLYYKPPFTGYQLKQIARKLEHRFDPYNPSLLASLYRKPLPQVVNGRLKYEYDQNGNPYVVVVEPELSRFRDIGFSPGQVIELLAEFNFIHPNLNCYRLLLKGKTTIKYIEVDTRLK